MDQRVSVIIPIYNRIVWAIEAVRSVQAQSYKNLEIIIINDGSTEDLTQLIDICGLDDRIQLVHQSNGGVSKARNLGLTKATGDYVAFLDSDDLFCATKIEEQLDYMVKHDLTFSHTSYFRMDQEGNIFNHIESGLFRGFVFPKIIEMCPIATPTVMCKRSLFLKTRFPEEISIGEDVCLWISIASEYEVGGILKPLSKVRIGESTAALNSEKLAIGLINILSFIIRHPEFRDNAAPIRNLLLCVISLYDMSTPGMATTGGSAQISLSSIASQDPARSGSSTIEHVDQIEDNSALTKVHWRNLVRTLRQRLRCFEREIRHQIKNQLN